MVLLDRRRVLFGSLATLLVSRPAFATAAFPFDDPVAGVLEIVAGNGASKTLSRTDLAGLGATRFTTALPWSDTPRLLEGPSVSELLRSVDPEGAYSKIEIEALDGFAVIADIEQFVADEAIIAVRQDGEFLPVSRKGPAFLMFPFDGRPELKDQARFGQCIWQISRIRLS